MYARAVGVLAICAVVSGAGIGCGSSPSGPPQSFPAGVWTWVDVPGTQCSDGSSTGFGVNPGDQADVVFFMDGGGACWDYLTCFGIPPIVSPTAAAGPFQAAQFQARSAQFVGTFLDRSAAGNPFARWSYVFVPYCTGDLHSGDREATFPLAGGFTARWEHRGRVNVAADLRRVVQSLPHARRLVVGGASAGGFGSLLQYDAVRAAFAADSTSLIDDSGPPLEGDALAPALRTAWISAWNLDPLLSTTCAACADDFSRIVPVLAARHPGDRIALLSSLQDQVIRGYFGLTPAEFEAALRKTVQDRFNPPSNAQAFLVSGEDHALLAVPGKYSAGSVSLTTWLTQLVDGDLAWRSAGP